MRRIQVDLVRLTSLVNTPIRLPAGNKTHRWSITAKYKAHNNDVFRHVGGFEFTGTSSGAIKEARRIAAELKVEFDAEKVDVVY